MDYILVFTFTTMSGLPDEAMLIIESLQDRDQCLALADHTIKTWASLANIQMQDVEFIDCMPVGKET